MFSHGIRRFSRTAIKNSTDNVKAEYLKIKDKQRAYQVDNGLLIHERHGPSGTLLQGITKLLLVAGLAQVGMFFYKVAMPPSNN